MIKYTVGIDLDGVIWEVLDNILDTYNRICRENVKTEDIKSYDISQYVNNQDVLDGILKFPSFVWEKVEIYPHTKAAIEKLLGDERIDLQIVTATPYNVAPVKIDNLLRQLPMLSNKHITLTERKDMMDLDFLVDDYEENLHGIVYKGGSAILINKVYNLTFPARQYGIVRCENLLEATELIIEAINEMERGNILH
jgi:5'(3')-deoxyribonucleotidase